MRSGLINVSFSLTLYAGQGGSPWSSTAASKHFSDNLISSAYYLGFNAGWLTSTGGPDSRWLSIPLRRLVYL